jgi:hypothetical protein
MATRSIPGQAYDASMGGTIAPGSVAVTEDKTTTGGSVGGCGEASLLAVVAPQLSGVSTSPSALGALIQWADNKGLTLAANGDSSPANLIAIAKQHFNIVLDSFSTLPSQYVGDRQIEVGISRAYNLGGQNSNVDGHYITIVGQTADGNYIVSDPNQPESENGQFIVYSRQQIQNADPFWYGAANKAPTGSGAALNNVTAGTTTGFDFAGFLSGIASDIPVVGGLLSPDTSTNPLDGIEKILGNLASWADPIRWIKLAFGLLLIGAAILSIVLPEAAAPAAAIGTAAAGAPEAAPAAYSAVKSIAKRPSKNAPQAPAPTPAQAVPPAASTVQRSFATRDFQQQQAATQAAPSAAAYRAAVTPQAMPVRPTPTRPAPTRPGPPAPWATRPTPTPAAPTPAAPVPMMKVSDPQANQTTFQAAQARSKQPMTTAELERERDRVYDNYLAAPQGSTTAERYRKQALSFERELAKRHAKQGTKTVPVATPVTALKPQQKSPLVVRWWESSWKDLQERRREQRKKLAARNQKRVQTYTEIDDVLRDLRSEK